MVFCGIDIGTTNTKAVLIDQENKLLNIANFPSKQTGKKVWYNQFCAVLDYFHSQGYLNNEKVICSLTTQGGSFILVDKHFSPLSRPYSWMENAPDTIVKDLNETLGWKNYYNKTGWNPDKWLMAGKIKELFTQNAIPKKTQYIATVPDFIYSNLTGKLICDITNAQITGLCDFMNSKWDEEILDWTGMNIDSLPPIVDGLKILFNDVQTPWGKIDIATSSHDQYAAMQASNLKKDTEIMIGTGTAWVLNYRTTKPVFDNDKFLTHPGKDIVGETFGNIVLTGNIFKSIGRGLDEILHNLNIDYHTLGLMEKKINKKINLKNSIDIDCLKVSSTRLDPSEIIKEYMIGSASLVAFLLERFIPVNSEKIIMTGGAATSTFWPQVIADLCRITVEAIDFPYFTAYGAALHAKVAYEGQSNNAISPNSIKTSIFEPVNTEKYHEWYIKYQQPMLDKRIKG